MQPQQPVPTGPTPTPATPPPGQQNPYAFIMDDKPNQPKRSLLPSGGSKGARLGLMAVGGLVVLVIGFMLVSLLFGGDKNKAQQLLSIAQQQTELIRVADLTERQTAVQRTSTQALAINTSLSLTSSQQQILPLLKKAGMKNYEKKLELTKSSKTDQQLAAAVQDNNYDQVFTDVITTGLKKYQTSLKQLYSTTKSTKEKQILQSAYKDASVLMGEDQHPND